MLGEREKIVVVDLDIRAVEWVLLLTHECVWETDTKTKWCICSGLLNAT